MEKKCSKCGKGFIHTDAVYRITKCIYTRLYSGQEHIREIYDDTAAETFFIHQKCYPL